MNNSDQIKPEGILLINKEAGWTSHDVVAKLRSQLPRKTKIGHAGTLDPFATGLLIILVGKAYTKRSEEFMNGTKTYITTIQWGATSETHDPEGEITETGKTTPTKKAIEKALLTQQGEVQQIPPMHSAIKINGKKLYNLARKGETIERPPRAVTIHGITLQSHDEENNQSTIKIVCSKGTYIRAIARDLGEQLGCGGYLTALERTQSGDYTLEAAEKIKTIENIENHLQKS